MDVLVPLQEQVSSPVAWPTPGLPPTQCAERATTFLSRRRPTPSVPKLEVSEAQVRAVVAQAVDMTNQLLALLYKLGTGQDPKQTAQVRGCGRSESGAQPPRRPPAGVHNHH